MYILSILEHPRGLTHTRNFGLARPSRVALIYKTAMGTCLSGCASEIGGGLEGAFRLYECIEHPRSVTVKLYKNSRIGSPAQKQRLAEREVYESRPTAEQATTK